MDHHRNIPFCTPHEHCFRRGAKALFCVVKKCVVWVICIFYGLLPLLLMDTFMDFYRIPITFYFTYKKNY